MIGSLYRTDDVPPRDSSSPEVAAAEARIKDIEAQIREVEDAAARVRQQERAAETTIGFLNQLGSNEGLAEAGAETLRDIARMISSETAEAGVKALDAAIEARQIEEALEDLQEQLSKARQALEAIALEDENRLYLAVDIAAEAAGPVALELSYLSGWRAGWLPSYELHLNTGKVPELELKRSVMIYQKTGENWRDVSLTLSSLAPSDRGRPWTLDPWRRRIEEPQPVIKRQHAEEDSHGVLSEPVVEPQVIVEQAEGFPWDADTDGPGVTYRFDHPVSVASGADVLRLEMDSLTTSAQVMAYAVPMWEDTAYRVARITNSFGEDLLEADEALYFVDGKLTTVEPFELLAAGAEAEIGFGPIRGLRVQRDVLDQSEGERGMISRSNQQVQRVEIEVENLTGQSWPLHLVDGVPYSEQEDLEISWKASPAVTEENSEKRRGILAWDFDIAAGETRKITLETTLSWPEGMVLR